MSVDRAAQHDRRARRCGAAAGSRASGPRVDADPHAGAERAPQVVAVGQLDRLGPPAGPGRVDHAVDVVEVERRVERAASASGAAQHARRRRAPPAPGRRARARRSISASGERGSSGTATAPSFERPCSSTTYRATAPARARPASPGSCSEPGEPARRATAARSSSAKVSRSPPAAIERRAVGRGEPARPARASYRASVAPVGEAGSCGALQSGGAIEVIGGGMGVRLDRERKLHRHTVRDRDRRGRGHREDHDRAPRGAQRVPPADAVRARRTPSSALATIARSAWSSSPARVPRRSAPAATSESAATTATSATTRSPSGASAA